MVISYTGLSFIRPDFGSKNKSINSVNTYQSGDKSMLWLTTLKVHSSYWDEKRNLDQIEDFKNQIVLYSVFEDSIES